MSMRVLCIWLPNWPSQRVAVAKLRADSEPRTQPLGPILLHARDPRRGRVVVAANETARRLGVLSHMTLSHASTLCPAAEFLEHDSHADMEGLLSLAEAAQCFSPITGLESVDAQTWAGRVLNQPQSLMLDITGIAPLFGSEAQLAQTVAEWIAEQGYIASIAMGDTVGAAWALANYRCRRAVADQLFAMENNPCAPIETYNVDGVNASESREALFYPLPVEALRLEIAIVTKLRRLGIWTIEHLLEIPRSGFAARFDPILLTRIDQAWNGQSEPIRAIQAAPDLTAETVLEHPTSNRESLEQIVRTLVERLTQALNQSGSGALRMVCRIELERNSLSVDHDIERRPTLAHVVQLGLFQPSSDAQHLAWLLLGQLDTRRLDTHNDLWIRSVGLQATLVGPIEWQQSNLFDLHADKHRDAIARLIDGLSSRLGRTAVVAPTLTRDPLPEQVVSWRPLTGLRNNGSRQETKRKLSKPPRRNYANDSKPEANSGEMHRRPTQLLANPRAIAVEVRTQHAPHIPTYVTHNGRRCRVVDAIGPERIESGWWQGSLHRREYFRIDLESGQRLWIFRDLKGGAWFLHGEFD